MVWSNYLIIQISLYPLWIPHCATAYVKIINDAETQWHIAKSIVDCN